MPINGQSMAILHRRADVRVRTPIGLLTFVLVSALVSACAGGDAGIANAKKLFARYQALERGFDPAMADLYGDDAVIHVKRVYADGVIRQLEIPGELYKTALRQSAAEAKKRGDVNDYSDVRYEHEGKGVRIRAKRDSHWQHYASPWSILVAPDAKGHWLIREEQLEQHLSVPAGGETQPPPAASGSESDPTPVKP